MAAVRAERHGGGTVREVEQLEQLSRTPRVPDWGAEARSSQPPAELADLVGDVERFFGEYWAKEPVLMRARSDLSGLISEAEMWEELDCGLLSRPYFTVFNEGVRTALADLTKTRKVVGKEIAGYADPEQVRRDFAAGATFKLSQVEHWHPRIRQLVQGMREHFRGGLEAFVFLSPPDKTAIRAHTDGSHTFVLQVAGVKDWVVGKLDGTSHSESTLHEGEIGPDRLSLTLRPGDVLYMPHGCPHYATARLGNSIHVAITVEEPTSLDLANVYLAQFLSDPRCVELSQRHHMEPVNGKIELLRDALLRYLETADPAPALDTAVKLRRLA